MFEELNPNSLLLLDFFLRIYFLKKWDEHIDELVFAYNTAIHDITRLTLPKRRSRLLKNQLDEKALET